MRFGAELAFLHILRILLCLLEEHCNGYFIERMSITKSVAVLRSGTCYILPLLGAFFADSYWGRYATIIVFSIVYILVCTAISLPDTGLAISCCCDAALDADR